MKDSNKLDYTSIYVRGYIWGLFPAKHYLKKDDIVLDGWFYKYFKWLFDFVSGMFSALLEFQNKEQVFIVKYSKKSMHKMKVFQYMMDNENVLRQVEKLIKKEYGKTKQRTSFKKESNSRKLRKKKKC